MLSRHTAARRRDVYGALQDFCDSGQFREKLISAVCSVNVKGYVKGYFFFFFFSGFHVGFFTLCMVTEPVWMAQSGTVQYMSLSQCSMQTVYGQCLFAVN